MREYSFRKDGFTFERVSKATARRVFNNDMPIMLCPCNLRPETGLFSTVVQNGKPKCFKPHGTRKGYAYLRLT